MSPGLAFRAALERQVLRPARALPARAETWWLLLRAELRLLTTDLPLGIVLGAYYAPVWRLEMKRLEMGRKFMEALGLKAFETLAEIGREYTVPIVLEEGQGRPFGVCPHGEYTEVNCCDLCDADAEAACLDWEEEGGSDADGE